MVEWKTFIESLNDYAGLLALLALVAAIVMPIIIYICQKRDRRRSLQNELDAMEETTFFPLPTEERIRYIRQKTLEKELNKD